MAPKKTAPAVVKHIDKPWGWEQLIEINPDYMVKRLCMKKGCQCSFQYHEHKRETVLVISGRLTIVLEDDEIILKPGDTLTLAPYTKHRMRSVDTDSIYIECSTPQMDDVIRISDDYGRK